MVNILNNFKKISGVAIALMLLQGSYVSADSADNLQAALANGVYTIRYQNVTPPNRSNTPKEKTFLMQSGSIYTANLGIERDFTDPYMSYKVTTGVVTSDGINEYSEFSTEQPETKDNAEAFEYTTCSLTLDDETFNFKRTKDKKGTTQYVSEKGKNKVAAVPAKYNIIGFKEPNFGDQTVTNLLRALMLNEKKPMLDIIYQKVKTGKNSDGLEYADYKAINLNDNITNTDGAFLDVIRYYFKDGKLVKIFAGRYTNKNGIVNGTRAIINVTEFKTTAENNLLKLPSEIKDVTKRQDEE